MGFAICWIWKFDAFSFIIPLEKTTIVGYALFGAIIAGGSKASIKLFHDLLKVKSTVVADREEDKIIRKEQEAKSKMVRLHQRAIPVQHVESATTNTEDLFGKSNTLIH